ncbi:hypothetical protein [Micromonospora saelicesensis]|uniref:hypothetical protein n=1 Tax=Micromonospora saelicesensis TaxID=285676 RepID=UPI000B897384|nr:hypothetical protein [Micromonospora saelicesensis]RAO52527.1 hypothetical protein PSN01_04072 [Micromonospora saelicesensis]RAO52741.1 hypothetical protein LUPAC06_05602 [Micromonospora saelicesensis]
MQHAPLRRAMACAYDREELPDEAETETADRRALEAAFHEAMVRTYERARDEAHYHAALLLRMVTEKAGWRPPGSCCTTRWCRTGSRRCGSGAGWT